LTEEPKKKAAKPAEAKDAVKKTSKDNAEKVKESKQKGKEEKPQDKEKGNQAKVKNDNKPDDDGPATKKAKSSHAKTLKKDWAEELMDMSEHDGSDDDPEDSEASADEKKRQPRKLKERKNASKSSTQKEKKEKKAEKGVKRRSPGTGSPERDLACEDDVAHEKDAGRLVVEMCNCLLPGPG
jgi:hypothetical protein